MSPSVDDGTGAHAILIVDDDGDVRDVISEFLVASGYAVRVAGGGEEALRLLQGDDGISLILSDVRMPDMTGIELAERARILRPNVHIVLTSGYFLPQPVSFRFLRKPFRLRELELVIRAEFEGPATS